MRKGLEIFPAEKVEKLAPETKRNFLLAFRQGLLIQLGAIEKLLGVSRTRIPKRKR